MKLILTGGFLGAGKTTAIGAAASHLQHNGQRVAVITNDQGSQLVDTEFMRANGFATGEVHNGCFCCHYDDLKTQLDLLSTQHNPDFVFAESVGSCTDLVATVLKPLRQAYPEMQASLSVFANATLVMNQILGRQHVFTKNIQYIYDRQLEEADVIVLTHADLLKTEHCDKIRSWAQQHFPGRPILLQNNHDAQSPARWLSTVSTISHDMRSSMSIDYEQYGAGEAELAWLDASVNVKGAFAWRAAAGIFLQLTARISEMNWPIGHLKALLKDGTHTYKMSVTTGGEHPTFPDHVSTQSDLLINARVQCSPSELRSLLDEVVLQTNSSGLIAQILRTDAFVPGFPVPTHRMP